MTTTHPGPVDKSGLQVTSETCFRLRGQQADMMARFLFSHKYGRLLCVRFKGYCGSFIQRYPFCFVFSPPFSPTIPKALWSLLSLCDRGSSGLCVLTTAEYGAQEEGRYKSIKPPFSTVIMKNFAGDLMSGVHSLPRAFAKECANVRFFLFL